MPFTQFQSNPKSYAKSHQMFLNNSDTGDGSMTAGAAQVIPAGNHGIQFTRNGTVIELQRNMVAQPLPDAKQKIGMFFGATKPRRDYNVHALAPGTADNGFRYLPFRQNHVTYMQLDGAATLCATGPLTGCTVAAGRDGANNVWFFHANENNAHGAAARASQYAMTAWAAGQAGVPLLNLRWCIMQTDYTGMAFVFGRQRAGGRWKFYVVDQSPGAGGAVNSDLNKWGDI